MTYDPEWTLKAQCVKCSHQYEQPVTSFCSDDVDMKANSEWFASCLHDLGWTTEPEILCPDCQPADEATLSPITLLQFATGLLFMALVLAAVIYGWGLSQ